MEGSFSDQWVHRWLQEIADQSFASLHYDTPALADATFAEIYGGGYVRQLVAWSQPSNRSIWSVDVTRWTGLAQGAITHFGIWSPDNELISYGRLPEKVILPGGGRGFAMNAGELAISIG